MIRHLAAAGIAGALYAAYWRVIGFRLRSDVRAARSGARWHRRVFSFGRHKRSTGRARPPIRDTGR